MLNLINIHSDHFCSASLSPLLLRSAPETARILCRSFTPKRHRQLRVKDLPKVPTWRLELTSNPRPSDRKVSAQPMRHHAPQTVLAHAYQDLCYYGLDTATKFYPHSIRLSVQFYTLRQSKLNITDSYLYQWLCLNLNAQMNHSLARNYKI